ncbi:MAG: LysR family transcriptional regulator [Hyphomicrobiales bacterium]|nr:LysR family transcriptional regulator [Hyphomicrobiales bacterium]
MRDVHEIVAFTRVAELGSFTSAAAEMKISTSAVSRYVSNLEQRLGVKLIARSTRRLMVTEVGREFLGKIRDPLHALEQATTFAANFDASMTGTLRIHSSLGVGQRLVSKAARTFAKRHPGVTVKLEIGTELPNLIGEGYDAGITVRNSTDVTDKSTRLITLAPIKYLVCASQDYVRSRGRPESIDDLHQHNCLIHHSVRGPYDWRFKEGGKERVVKIKGNFETNDSIILQDAARDGIGIARLPDYAISEDLATGALVVLFDSLISWGDVIAAIVSAGKQPTRVDEFIDFLMGYVSTHTEL